MTTPMKLKINDTVILSPDYPHPESLCAPIWGGQFGYLTGTVMALITHDHDAKNHVARVRWSNGETNGFQEHWLMRSTPDIQDVAKDFALEVPLDEDIGLLYWDTQDFYLGIIECTQGVNRHPLFTLMMSESPLRSIENSDYNILTSYLFSADHEEYACVKLGSAVSRFYNTHRLPSFRSLPLPLPTPTSIRELAKSLEDPTKPAVARFILPIKISDVAALTPADT